MKSADILKIENKLKETKAKDIMSKFAITIRPEEFLINAAHLMMRFKVSGLPVVSREDKIEGIITATDLFRVMGNAAESLSGDKSKLDKAGVKVENVMTKDVHTIEEDTTLYEIIMTMHEKNIHTLPVIKGNEITGIIGRRDVLNNFYNLLGADKQG